MTDFVALAKAGVFLILLLGWPLFVALLHDHLLKEEKAKIETMQAKLAKKLASKKRQWVEKYGEEIAEVIASNTVKVGMAEEMVLEAWGQPTTKDQLKETQNYSQHRLVFGTPRRGSGANYVVIRDGLVTKVTTNHQPLVIDDLAFEMLSVEKSSKLKRYLVLGGLGAPWVCGICYFLFLR